MRPRRAAEQRLSDSCSTRGEWWKEHRACAAAAACEGMTKTQPHRHARVWTKTQGRGRKLVAIQTVAPALPAADCVDLIEQRMQGVGWLCGTHCWTCLDLDCHEFRMRLQLHALCAIHTAITFPPLVSCTATLTVVAPRHSAAAPHRAVMDIKRRPVERPVEHACAEAPCAPRN